VPLEWKTRADRVFFICRFGPDDATWLESFDDTRRQASTAGAFDVGFCSSALLNRGEAWTNGDVQTMIGTSTCVFAAALDCEGFLVWKVYLASHD
jgi:hypothetical protein